MQMWVTGGRCIALSTAATACTEHVLLLLLLLLQVCLRPLCRMQMWVTGGRCMITVWRRWGPGLLTTHTHTQVSAAGCNPYSMAY
jgi:hypothetical protein